MAKYVLKRVLVMIPILLVVTIVVFTLMCFVPGDPVQISLGEGATQEQIEAVRESMGLNDPYLVRLFRYLKGIITEFDFGKSFTNGTSVRDELMIRFPNTLILAVASILFSVCIGVPIGIYCAVNANKFADRLWMFITILGNSMPSFWLALMLVLLFSLRLKWLPSNGADGWKYFILPILANSIGSLAGMARQTRASMLEVVRSDYVVTARSKGLSERKVIWGHALPNALIPIITVAGGHFGRALGGTTVIENVFTIPGIGSYMVNGINARDYNVVQGSIIYIAFSFSVIMLLTDLVYAFVDPRIKARYSSKSKKKVKENPSEGEVTGDGN